MRIEIEGLLGIRAAAVDLEPGKVVEVIGPNASGKTSLAVCAQALLAYDANPLGLGAGESRASYLLDGEGEGKATLADSDGGPYATWKPGSQTMEAPTGGEKAKPISRPEAVGIVDFTSRRSARERAGLFHSSLLPPEAEVLAKLKELLAKFMDAEDLVGVLAVVEERGYAAAEAIYTDRAREAKRSWTGVTSRPYGVKVAADWRPDGWLADFDSLSVSEAEEAVVTARDALAAIHRVQAISEADMAAAAKAAAGIPALEANVRELGGAAGSATEVFELAAADHATAERAFEDFHAKIQAAAAKADGPELQHCPHCGAEVVVVSGNVRQWSKEDAKGLAAHAAKVKRIEKKRPALNDQLRECLTAYQRTQAEAESAREAHLTAKVELRELRGRSARVSVDGEVETAEHRRALAELEADVEHRRAALEMVKAVQTAGGLHDTAVRYSEVRRLLGPSGVRGKLLTEGLGRLNAGLRRLADVSGWPVVRVKEDGQVLVSTSPLPGAVSRAVLLCSESERWRAQASIQLTLAALTGSGAVVLDRGDILDPVGREGLRKACAAVLGKCPIAVLVCSTMQPGVPLVEGKGPGKVFIRDGRTA